MEGYLENLHEKEIFVFESHFRLLFEVTCIYFIKTSLIFIYPLKRIDQCSSFLVFLVGLSRIYFRIVGANQGTLGNTGAGNIGTGNTDGEHNQWGTRGPSWEHNRAGSVSIASHLWGWVGTAA